MASAAECAIAVGDRLRWRCEEEDDDIGRGGQGPKQCGGGCVKARYDGGLGKVRIARHAAKCCTIIVQGKGKEKTRL